MKGGDLNDKGRATPPDTRSRRLRKHVAALEATAMPPLLLRLSTKHTRDEKLMSFMLDYKSRDESTRRVSPIFI